MISCNWPNKPRINTDHRIYICLTNFFFMCTLEKFYTQRKCHAHTWAYYLSPESQMWWRRNLLNSGGELVTSRICITAYVSSLSLLWTKYLMKPNSVPASLWNMTAYRQHFFFLIISFVFLRIVHSAIDHNSQDFLQSMMRDFISNSVGQKSFDLWVWNKTNCFPYQKALHSLNNIFGPM